MQAPRPLGREPMTQTALQTARTPSRRPARDDGCRGQQLIEFTLVLLPLLFLVFGLANIAWSIWVCSTLQSAVREGVRYGATNQAVPTGSDQTTEIKKVVQTWAIGLLGGTSARSMIHIHYYQPPAPTSTALPVDVSVPSLEHPGQGNAGGNIMVVSVDNYPLPPLTPRLYNWSDKIDNSKQSITVSSADRIEPTRNPPPQGAAP